MGKLASKYKSLFHNKTFITGFVVGLLLLIGSMFVNYAAATYAYDRESNPVTDIILSNTPVFDVDGTFIFGPLIFWAIMIVILLANPKTIPFSLKSIALFILIRSAFISMTHIGPYPNQINVDAIGPRLAYLWSFISTGGDMFFSAHTGLPFLMGLIFWRNKVIRWFCIFAATFFGVVVLLGHLHYTIDVASAFFITYTIYHIAEWTFPKDKKLFLGN